MDDVTTFNHLLEYVGSGGDIATFAILWFIWKLHNRLLVIEIKLGHRNANEQEDK